MAKAFGTTAAFKASLEARLRAVAAERAVPFATLQLKFVMERLLARLFRGPGPPWLLKGGFAMDLRFRPRARTTKDIDLAVSLAAVGIGGDVIDAVRDRLQDAVDVDLGDHFTYRIGPPKQDLANAPGGGARYPCEAVLLGKVYARFHVDVGLGDAPAEGPERLVGDDFLAFAGIAPAAALALPLAAQFAEKLHAYSYPWKARENTRTKDLVDLVLLIERGPLDVGRVRDALRRTFTTRGTHPPPAILPRPPAAWGRDFPALAEEAGLSTGDCIEAFAVLDRYWAENALGAG